MRILFFFIFSIILLSCSPSENKENENKSDLKKSTFNYSDFIISKGQLGKIKIGMTITEAEKQFSAFEKRESDAINFGWDGGGAAYLYYFENELIFGLIPRMNSDTILAIIAVAEKLETTNNLNPKALMKELQQAYPNKMIHFNLMNQWEYMEDETNDWTFVFMTKEKNRIGKYSELQTESKPLNLEVKADWICIE